MVASGRRSPDGALAAPHMPLPTEPVALCGGGGTRIQALRANSCQRRGRRFHGLPTLAFFLNPFGDPLGLTPRADPRAPPLRRRAIAATSPAGNTHTHIHTKWLNQHGYADVLGIQGSRFFEASNKGCFFLAHEGRRCFRREVPTTTSSLAAPAGQPSHIASPATRRHRQEHASNSPAHGLSLGLARSASTRVAFFLAGPQAASSVLAICSHGRTTARRPGRRCRGRQACIHRHVRLHVQILALSCMVRTRRRRGRVGENPRIAKH